MSRLWQTRKNSEERRGEEETGSETKGEGKKGMERRQRQEKTRERRGEEEKRAERKSGEKKREMKKGCPQGKWKVQSVARGENAGSKRAGVQPKFSVLVLQDNQF